MRAAYRYAKRRFGEVPEPFTVAAHHPGLLFANAIHETALERASRKLPRVCASSRCIGRRAPSAARGVWTSARCCSAWTAWTSSG
ncbi:alkylhydroperoxidase like protein, AhpD family [Mycobacterium xenopi 3993]|nr:alkylhydroperoxidase like protein, AhpD family [Mycobacterium xenopi 3993]